jgi:hypothetical protein
VFYLTNSTSFGELLFFQGLFQKNRQEGPNYQTDYQNSITKDTLEDSRRHEKAVGESGTPEASRGGRAAPGPWLWALPVIFCEPPPPTLRINLSPTSSQFDLRVHVHPIELYIRSLTSLVNLGTKN